MGSKKPQYMCDRCMDRGRIWKGWCCKLVLIAAVLFLAVNLVLAWQEDTKRQGNGS